jgi:hypothetical protein
MSDPFDTHTHGRFYGTAPCQSCKAKDADIERLRSVIKDTISSFYVDKPPYYQIHFEVGDRLEAALEDCDVE